METIISARQERLQAIKHFLNMLASAENSARAYGQFTLLHGKEWQTAPRPEGIKSMQMRQCFSNAQKLLFKKPGEYTYVEGYACSGSLAVQLPMHHAWVVDDEGNVIDPTWDDDQRSAYFGVPFKTSYVLEKFRSAKQVSSLLDNFEDKWSLLRDPKEAEIAVLPLDLFEHEEAPAFR